MRRTLVLLGVLVVVAGSSSAYGSTWEIDPAHTRAGFAVRHLMVSKVRGTMGTVTGSVSIDDADVTKSTVEATIDVTTIDTREPKRDTHLKSPDFFDVGKYPTIAFKSKNVTRVASDKFTVVGDLTMHGVTREVTLDVEGSLAELRDPTGKARLGGVATTKLNRNDFGVQWNKALEGGGTVVGNEVDVTIDVELIKKTAAP